MRRINVLIIGVIVAILLVGCGEKKNQEDYYEYSEDCYEYKFDEAVSCFDVSKDGLMYCVSNDNEETIIGSSSEYHMYATLSVLDEAGELKETFRLPGYVNWIQLEEENQYLYYLDVKDWNHQMIYRYNLGNQEVELLWQIPVDQVVNNIFVSHEEIYVFGYDTSGSTNKSIQVGFQNNFVGKVDLSTGQIDKFPIDSPCCVSMTPKNNLVIYVYEADMIYYFIEYDTMNQSFGEKIYHFMQGVYTFYICNEENGYFYIKFKQDQYYLTYCELEADAVEVELAPFEYNGQELMTKYGNIFLINPEKTVITRFKNSVYMNDNKEIKLLAPIYYEGRNPFGCGYRTQIQYKDYEELALSVLARDTDYDLFLLNTDLPIAENIRTKGSFYPLNEVEGVEEYLDACFPYIKDAAINEEGDVWMLPVYIEMPALLYQEEMCSDYGCSSVPDLTFEDFFTWIGQLKENNILDQLTYINGYRLTRGIVNQYWNQYNQFDTPEFRYLVRNMKEHLNYLGQNQVDVGVYQQVLNGQCEEFLFLHIQGSRTENTDEMEECNLAPIPRLNSEDQNLASCQFIAVNPDSKNLKVVLEYVSDLCQYMLSQNSPSMIIQKDISSFTQWEQEKYEIYSNGEIAFALPDEIVIEQIEKYFEDEISLEEVISEAERRLSIYIEE